MPPRTTFHAEMPLQALLVEQALLLAQQLEATADAAPDGHVLARVEALAVPAARELARLARVEALAVPAARELARQAVQATLQAQAPAAEKKGRPPAAAPAAPNLPGTRGAPGGTS